MKKYGPDRVNVAASYHALGLAQRQLGDIKTGKILSRASAGCLPEKTWT